MHPPSGGHMQLRSVTPLRLVAATDDRPNTPLWALHFPAQNDWYAAPTEIAARELADSWNAFIARTTTLGAPHQGVPWRSRGHTAPGPTRSACLSGRPWSGISHRLRRCSYECARRLSTSFVGCSTNDPARHRRARDPRRSQDADALADQPWPFLDRRLQRNRER